VADILKFNEGLNYVWDVGIPDECYFLLSSEPCASLSAASTLAGGVGEITGTGYARQSQAVPNPTNGAGTFNQMSWSTGAATNWPSSVCSVILVTSADNSGHAICAWNLVAGGGARNLAAANTIEQVQPSMSVS
jgi:hypothetical protein